MLARPDLADLIAREALPDSFLEVVERYFRPVAEQVLALRQARGRPVIVAVSGAQGSGKSTMVVFLKALLERGAGLKVAGFSIDDIYLTRAERERLAREVHPLLATRGVPGTHDVGMGLALMEVLMHAAPGDLTPIPVFDKAIDDRAPSETWPRFEGRADVVLFDGWCLGAEPQPPDELTRPINELERLHDADGRYRRYVNAQLEGPYRELFGLADLLIAFQAPSFEAIFDWRRLQEEKLRLARAAGGADARRVMDDDQLRVFMMHYERITRAMLQTLPARADILFELSGDHAIRAMRRRPGR